jgi:hypothetical protein
VVAWVMVNYSNIMGASKPTEIEGCYGCSNQEDRHQYTSCDSIAQVNLSILINLDLVQLSLSIADHDRISQINDWDDLKADIVV